MKPYKFRIAAVIACVVVVIGTACIGCGAPPEADTSISYGFSYPNYGDPRPRGDCAFYVPQDTFPIDAVKITFYFGDTFGEDLAYERAHERNIPAFTLYFADEDGNELYEIRTSQENYVSEEYRVRHSIRDKTVFVEYTHREDVLVPQALFAAETGCLCFRVGGVDVNSVAQKFEDIHRLNIYYKSDGAQVVLSVKPSDLAQ